MLCSFSGVEEALFFLWQRRPHERTIDSEVVESVNSVIDVITAASSLPVPTPVNVSALTSVVGVEMAIPAEEVVAT